MNHEGMPQTYSTKAHCRTRQGFRTRTAVTSLYHKEIIDQDDMDEVRSKKIRKDVNEDLIFMLMRRGPEAFPNLVEGLQRKQPFLACSLLKEGKVNLQQTYNTKQVLIP